MEENIISELLQIYTKNTELIIAEAEKNTHKKCIKHLQKLIKQQEKRLQQLKTPPQEHQDVIVID
jgi:hypothetical protein